MSFFLGIDTSNYTTSVALYNSTENTVKSVKKLLEVNLGEVGLRQSDALFQHIKQVHLLIDELLNDFDGKITAVGVSSKPRNQEGSYMPCFLAGVSVANSIASALRIPCYNFSHQSGHIAAALFSCGRLDLIDKKILAFHISGGTTEALLVEKNEDNIINCEIVGKSLDLKMGQAIDRAGVMLCLPFPAGKYLDELSLKGTSPIKFKPCIKGTDCCISGIENKCLELKNKNESKENIARFVIDSCCKTVDKMTENLLEKYGDLPLLFAGGVMSNTIIKEFIIKKYGALFAQPQFSSDNACGTAVLASIKHKI